MWITIQNLGNFYLWLAPLLNSCHCIGVSCHSGLSPLTIPIAASSWAWIEFFLIRLNNFLAWNISIRSCYSMIISIGTRSSNVGAFFLVKIDIVPHGLLLLQWWMRATYICSWWRAYNHQSPSTPSRLCTNSFLSYNFLAFMSDNKDLDGVFPALHLGTSRFECVQPWHLIYVHR